jgi:hypothetical protein
VTLEVVVLTEQSIDVFPWVYFFTVFSLSDLDSITTP